MEAKEPMAVYNTHRSAEFLRAKIISELEHEEDTDVLQLLYSFVLNKRNEKHVDHKPKYSLSALHGILGGGVADDISYDELIEMNLKEKYAL